MSASPSARMGRKSLYPWACMPVGSSFFIPYHNCPRDYERSLISASHQWSTAKPGRKGCIFHPVEEGTGFRVFCTQRPASAEVEPENQTKYPVEASVAMPEDISDQLAGRVKRATYLYYCRKDGRAFGELSELGALAVGESVSVPFPADLERTKAIQALRVVAAEWHRRAPEFYGRRFKVCGGFDVLTITRTA